LWCSITSNSFWWKLNEFLLQGEAKIMLSDHSCRTGLHFEKFKLWCIFLNIHHIKKY
jgi:hypothetical protein